MSDDIDGIGSDHPGKPKAPKAWKPWTPPVPPPPPPMPLQPFQVPSAGESGGSESGGNGDRPRPPRLVGDANRVSSNPLAFHAMPDVKMDFGAMLAAANSPDKLSPVETAAALGELGVTGTLTQVAVAFTRTTFDPQAIAASLRAFAKNLDSVVAGLHAIPGVGDALHVLGGVGGIVAGATQFAKALEGMKRDGPGLAAGLAAAAGAAKLVGGTALALSPFCPPLAATGTAITLAGAALDLGRLAWEHRDGAKAFAGKAIAGSVGLAKNIVPIVSNNGASMVGTNDAAIVSNNGASMVGGGPAPSFGWLTG